MSQIKISPGNSKLGAIPSVSLPAVETCRVCGCQSKCYAKRLERLRPAVHQAYQTNLKILQSSPETYWREVEAAIMLSRFFRFHVSGDIPDQEYLIHIVKIAERNPHCQILCFTKRFEFVNDFLEAGNEFPENLHMILSAWVGFELANPYSLPVAHVRYRDGTTTASDKAVECEGNCSECAVTKGGCWSLKRGEEVVFNEH